MKSIKNISCCVAWLLSMGTFMASGQSTISVTANFAYSANAGWIDFRPSALDGVKVTETYLSGRAYAANFGWIDLGDGTPANGHAYSNASATDFGVNMDQFGNLTGYAYSANVGWISFEQVSGKPHLDYLNGQFSGSAYSANIGWISLDTSQSNLITSLACPDADVDGIGDAHEMLYFGQLGKIDAFSDYDSDGIGDVAEYIAGTSPVDAQDYLRITNQEYNETFSKVTLTFTSSPRRLYTIEQSTDLQSPWADSGKGIFSPSSLATSDKGFSFPAGSRRFFRVIAHKPLQP